MAINNEFLFTGDAEGIMKQWKTRHWYEDFTDLLKKDYGKVHDSGITGMKSCRESSTFFTADLHNIKQWGQPKDLSENPDDNIEYMVVRDYEIAHEGNICKILFSAKEKYLYSLDESGSIRVWDVEDQQNLAH